MVIYASGHVLFGTARVVEAIKRDINDDDERFDNSDDDVVYFHNDKDDDSTAESNSMACMKIDSAGLDEILNLHE